ncbi:ABC transporter permease [Arthrobacter zhaoguopingii]|uniref:ABC transporter permease n=1 Tax=Arthrobacter zhaoguopingii TaxID=2681491 RepID=UPI00135A3DA3|nr:ABC transporter permease [Arthrobacter zhaoguopingii]
MSAHTTTSPSPTKNAPRPRPGSGITFTRVLRSEWIKVTTVRSTVILIASTVLVMVGLALLGAWGYAQIAQTMNDGGMPANFQAQGPGDPAVDALTTPSSGLIFGQLLIASLAVVLIASEWATGMIRSTMVAVPGRTPALLAKTAVIAAVAFLVGLLSALVSYLIAQPILGSQDLDFALTQDGVLASIINTGTYLALVAVISISLGILLRNTAGGVVTAVGIFFVLPVIMQLLSGLAEWVTDAARFLPGEAGNKMVAVTAADDALTQLQGGLVMGAWALAFLAAALIVTKKRDV